MRTPKGMKLIVVGLSVFLFTFSAWAGKFLEKFDDRDLEAWRELIQLDSDIGKTSWEVVEGTLEGATRSVLIRLLTMGDERWSNYDFEFDVKPLEKHNEGNITIAARVKGNRMIICIIGDAPRFAKAGGGIPAVPEPMATCMGGNFHSATGMRIFAQEPSPLLKLNKWSNLKVSVHGDTLTFWINGKAVLGPVVMEPKEGTLSLLRGKIGVGLANYTARFDNLAITGGSVRDNGGFSVSPNAKIATTWARLKQF